MSSHAPYYSPLNVTLLNTIFFSIMSLHPSLKKSETQKLKGVLHLLRKISMFRAPSQNNQQFLEK